MSTIRELGINLRPATMQAPETDPGDVVQNAVYMQAIEGVERGGTTCGANCPSCADDDEKDKPKPKAGYSVFDPQLVAQLKNQLEQRLTM